KNMIYVTHDQVEAMTLGDRIVVMSDGIIQQQGTPEELYERPTNKFVAGFIGSPTMNFLDAQLEGTGADTAAVGNGFRLSLSPEVAARAGSLNARDVTVGLRPSVFKYPAGEGSPIELQVVVSEYLGAHTILVTRCAGVEVQVELNAAAPPPPGSTLTFSVAPGDVMLFDHNGTRL
ncbi:MAG: TOBE domain-containing protein, partial [Pseudomonadota bacterium]